MQPLVLDGCKRHVRHRRHPRVAIVAVKRHAGRRVAASLGACRHHGRRQLPFATHANGCDGGSVAAVFFGRGDRNAITHAPTHARWIVLEQELRHALR